MWWLALPRWFRGALIACAIAVPLILAAILYVRHREQAAVQMHEQDITADVAARVTNAYLAADVAAANQQIADERAAQITEDAIRHAETENPNNARAAAGPVSRAAVDSLRSRSR